MAENKSSIDPIFIVGVGRSGTTLLVNLLGAHPVLAPVYETPFIRKVIRHCEKASVSRRRPLFRISPVLFRRYLLKECRKLRERLFLSVTRLPDPSTIKQKYETFPFGLAHCILYTAEEMAQETDAWIQQLMSSSFSDDDIYRSAREFIDRLFAIHCSRFNKPVWINKTPALLNYLDRLSKLYPSARCIHIVRDGRDSATSVLSLPWGPKSVGEAARHWRSHILSGRRKVHSTKMKYKEIRYEDLIESPSITLAQVLSFLELDSHSSEILKSMPVYDTSRGRWRTHFSARDRKVFVREAGDLLIELGYERDDSWAY